MEILVGGVHFRPKADIIDVASGEALPRGKGMETTNVDPQQQRRRMRAALESMRRKRSLAVVGFVIAFGLLVMAHYYTEFPDVVRWNMRLAAPIIFLPLALPFLRSRCPQCNGRYHTITSLWRHPDHTPPCRSCGFSIDKHISRY